MAVDTRSTLANLAEVPPSTALTLGLSLLALPGVAFLASSLDVSLAPVAEIAVEWLVVAAVVGLALGVEGRSLASLGVRRPGWADAGYLVATAVATLLVLVAADPLVAALGLPLRGDAGAMPADAGLAAAVTTGVAEEVLFRGYPVERLLDATDSPLVAGGVTWGVFTLAHAAYWPLGNLLKVAAAAGVLTAVYLRRRTLVPVVGAHVAVWAFAVLGRFYG